MSSRASSAAGVAKGDGQVAEVFGQFGLVDVDADTGDCHSIDQLYQDTGGLAVIEHEVVGPAEVALYASGLRDGPDGRDTEAACLGQ